VIDDHLRLPGVSRHDNVGEQFQGIDESTTRTEESLLISFASRDLCVCLPHALNQTATL
jgi:hypothetical protein